MTKFVSSKDLGIILGLSERRVNQIAKEGVIFKRDITGKFDVALSVENYFKVKLVPSEDLLTLDHEKTLHEKAKRLTAELNLKVIMGELHKASDIEMIMTGMLITFRNRILGIPSALAPQIAGLKNVSKVQKILDSKLREALSELSAYDPALFLNQDCVTVDDSEEIINEEVDE